MLNKNFKEKHQTLISRELFQGLTRVRCLVKLHYPFVLESLDRLLEFKNLKMAENE